MSDEKEAQKSESIGNKEEEDKCEIVYLEEEEIDDEEEDEAHDDTSVHTFTEHEDAVYCVAFCRKILMINRNNAQTPCIAFASGGGDDKAVLYHLIDGEEPEMINLKGHTDSISCLCFSADGSMLVTGGLDGILIVWDSIDGHEISRLTGPTGDIEWVNWHPSLPAVLCGDATGLTWLFSAKIGKCVKVYSTHIESVTCGGFRSDGSEIWTAGKDKHLRIWAPKSGQATTVLHGSVQFHRDEITTGCNNRNGAIIATGDASGIVKLMQCDTGKVIGQLDTGENSIEKIEFSYDDKYIAVASMGGTVTIWNPNDLKIRHALQHPKGVTSLSWHPKMPYVISSCADGAVRVWDARNGELISEMYGHGDVITGLDTFYDGSVLLIVTSSDDTSVKLWVFDDKNPIKPIPRVPIENPPPNESKPEAQTVEEGK